MTSPELAPVAADAALEPIALETDGFDAFYAREYASMLRTAIGLVDRRDRAEELVQDAFERTLLRWSRLDNPAAFARTVLVNGARSELRRRAVARRWMAPKAAVDEVPEPNDQLLAALATLTPKRRVAIVLRIVEDRSEAETARLMQCRVGTVKSLVSRGLADLRKALSS